jgi:hypothetical protein
MMTGLLWFDILQGLLINPTTKPKGEIEMSSYKILTSIVAWLCFIFGVISLVAPTIIGISTGALAGTINDVEAGKLWFYRHGLSWLIGFALFLTYLFAVRVRKELE